MAYGVRGDPQHHQTHHSQQQQQQQQPGAGAGGSLLRSAGRQLQPPSAASAWAGAIVGGGQPLPSAAPARYDPRATALDSTAPYGSSDDAAVPYGGDVSAPPPQRARPWTGAAQNGTAGRAADPPHPYRDEAEDVAAEISPRAPPRPSGRFGNPPSAAAARRGAPGPPPPPAAQRRAQGLVSPREVGRDEIGERGEAAAALLDLEEALFCD